MRRLAALAAWVPAPALVALVLSTSALLPLAATAATWHVLPDGTGDAPTIQAAVDSSAAGDSILVAAGTYLENVVLEPGRLLIGSWDAAFSVSDLDLHPTTVDGDSSGPCLMADFAEEDPDGRIAGFRLVDGSGLPFDTSTRRGGGLYARGLGRISNCLVEECTAHIGAGLYVEAERPELSEIVARLNSIGYFAGDGGGLFLSAGDEGRVTGSEFSDNGVEPGGSADRGVGMFVTGGRVEIDSCTIARNGREYPGSGVVSFGSGIFSDCDSLILLDCVIVDNRRMEPPRFPNPEQEGTAPGAGAGRRGGYAEGGGVRAAAARIERCLITGNGAVGYESAHGGGVWLGGGILADCAITDNAAFGGEYDGSGGGISGGTITVRNCRIERNWTWGGTSSGWSGGIGANALTISNTTVRHNTSFGGRNARTAGISTGFIDACNITVYSNSARAGSWGSQIPHVIAGVKADSGRVTHSIIADNTYSGPSPQVTGGLGGAIESRHNLFHGNTGDPHWGLTVAEAHVYADPLFADSTFHLALHSPAIDRGDPAILDPDGSVADLGAWGGPAGAMERPARVLGLEALRTPAGNSLTWDANPEPGIDGYAVYRLPSAGTHPGLETFAGSTTQTSFTDPVGPPDPDVLYRVSAYDAGRRGGGYSEAVSPAGSGPVRREALAPTDLRRLGASPSRGAVTFEVRTPASVPARLQVFDIRGRRVWARNQPVPAGISELRWPALDELGQAVSSGIYFVQIDFAGESYRQKVVVVK